MKPAFSIENIPVAAMVTDKNFNILFTNEQCQQFLNYSKTELNNKLNVAQIADCNSTPLLEKNSPKVLIGKNNFTIILRCKNGNHVSTIINSSKLENDLFLLVLTDITEKEKIKQEFNAQEQFFKKVINTYPDFIFAKNWDGEFTLVNQAVADIYGTTIEDLLGKKDADFNKNEKEVAHFLEDDREVMRSLKQKMIIEEPVTNPVTKKKFWYQTIKVPLQAGKLEDRQVLGISSDVTELWNASQEIKKLNIELEERIRQRTQKLELANSQINILFKEMNHRVKNNLQIISSLLNMQSSYFENEHFKMAFQNSREQISTISLIHDILYRNNSLSSMDINFYLTSLINGRIINSLYNETVTYQININSPISDFVIDSITPLGLLINELATNSLKHAFTDCKNGKITVTLNHINKKRYELIYSDNGKGFSKEKIANDKKHHLGLELIEAFTSQLDGTFTLLSSKKGVEYKFTITLK